VTQYVNWDDAFAFLTYSTGTDINAVAVNDAASLTSDEVSLDGYDGAEIGVASVEDDTGACDGNVLVYVLGYGALGWETISDAPMLAAVMGQVRNQTRYAHASISAERYSAFKALVYNDCGQQVAISIKYKRSQLASS
jgi:hypothetical protein